jgi:hypothetical protein
MWRGKRQLDKPLDFVHGLHVLWMNSLANNIETTGPSLGHGGWRLIVAQSLSRLLHDSTTESFPSCFYFCLSFGMASDDGKDNSIRKKGEELN